MSRAFCYLLLLLALGLLACNQKNNQEKHLNTPTLKSSIKYAQGFDIVDYGDYQLLKVYKPWTGAEKSFTYLLVNDLSLVPTNFIADAVIQVPVNRLMVTSTTHIPALEMLGSVESLVGFPGLSFISSTSVRQRISQGLVVDIGQNEAINTELVIAHQPEVLVGFGVDGNNKTYIQLEQAGIPVIYNGDWTETTPLGKAEWIKFFGVLLGKEKEADAWFEKITYSYQEVQQLAANASTKPTVFSGAMWQDIWYLPHGNSWASIFLKDAGGQYLWADSEGIGSLALNLETVLDQAAQADFWIGPAQFTTYEQLEKENGVYRQFDAFKNRKVYTFSALQGETGGIIYYELAPSRPDLVLQDLVKILHPELVPDYELYFFRPLE